jgi:hypothetical protein
MIRYALRCAEGHEFESWFRSAEAYDGLAARGLISCAVCGGGDVAKALMAPRVAAEGPLVSAPVPAGPAAPEAGKLERAIARMRARVEKESTWVGDRFAAEARAIHEGERPERAIWGEAKPAEAKALIEDGIAVAPLPFGPRRKMT